MRHKLERVPDGLLARTKRAWALAGDIAERPPKRARLSQPVWNAISVMASSVSRSSAFARSIRRVSR